MLINCQICNLEIKAGLSLTSHYRTHVRRKEAVEYREGHKLTYVSAEAQAKLIEENPYAQLGNDPLPGQPKCCWDITNMLNSLQAINPKEYYITDGDAIAKADKLVKDCYGLAVKSKYFRDKLIKARGAKKYLETAYEHNRLCVKGKDPRYNENELR